MAKGLEDTAFYRYNRLVSSTTLAAILNGSESQPLIFTRPTSNVFAIGLTPCWRPSTHDSKRSEDVRARIDVLSEIPGLWRLRIRDWRRFNRIHRSMVNDKPAPSPNDEYLLYQTLAGAWPSER